MRKLILMAAMALAAVAFTAAPASAHHDIFFSYHNPGFPSADHDPNSWRAATVYETATGNECSTSGCDFGEDPYASGGGDYEWNWYNPDSNRYEECHGGIAGVASGDGSAQITSARRETHKYPAHQYPWCSGYQMSELPWQGDICANVNTGEFWFRHDIAHEYQTYGASGYTFGELTGTFDGDVLYAATLRYEDSDGPDPYVYTGMYSWEHTAEFPLDEAVAMAAATGTQNQFSQTTDTPCSWPELQQS